MVVARSFFEFITGWLNALGRHVIPNKPDGYSFFQRQQPPTAFTIASQYLVSQNSFIFLNFSFLIKQLFINLFFIYTWELYIILRSQHFLVSFSFSSAIINSLSIFCLLSFLYCPLAEWVDFPGVLVVSAAK